MAAMKTSAGRLYTLFNACLPNNEKVKKRLNFIKIIESKEYNELKAYPPFEAYFDKYFSKEKLLQYDVSKLDELTKAIPKVIPLIENISNAITYGNGPELTEQDIPDFSSVDSMDNLAAKLKIDQPDPNMTNITKYNFMDIFSDKTIKDPRDVMKSISMDEIENPVEFISRNLSQTNYCIRAKDMNDICNKYVQQVSELKSNIESIKKEKWKLRYKKWLYIGLTLILLIVISKYELLSYDVSMLLFGLSFILLVLYFFIG